MLAATPCPPTRETQLNFMLNGKAQPPDSTAQTNPKFIQQQHFSFRCPVCGTCCIKQPFVYVVRTSCCVSQSPFPAPCPRRDHQLSLCITRATRGNYLSLHCAALVTPSQNPLIKVILHNSPSPLYTSRSHSLPLRVPLSLDWLQHFNVSWLTSLWA